MPQINQYDDGDMVRAKVTIKVEGVLTDPTTLKFKTKDPAGIVVTKEFGVDAELVKNSVGDYQVDFTVTPGEWFYRWEATGTAHGAEERKINVRKGAFS